MLCAHAAVVSSKSNGVNGFGNVPFAVNSRRVAASQNDELTRLKKWDALLGLFK